MNEYYTAVKDKVANDSTAGATEPNPSEAKSGVKKKKDGSQHGKEAADKATSKRRRAETAVVKPPIDDPPVSGCADRVVGSFERPEDLQSSAGPSPIDDSGIQTSLREEDVVTGGVAVVEGRGEEKRAEVLISSKSEETKPIVTDVDMDEGISTSSSWTRAAAVASQPHQGVAQLPVAGSLAHPVNRSSVQVANLTGTAISAAAGVASTASTTTSTSSTAPPTIVPSQSLATSSTCPSAQPPPHSSCVGSQHSPTTPGSHQAATVTVADDVSTTTTTTTTTPPPTARRTDPAANTPDDVAPAAGPTSPLVTCTATGQSESHLVAAKMDAEGAVPAAAAFVTAPEPGNAASAQQPPASPPTPPPPLLLPPTPAILPLQLSSTEPADSNRVTQAAKEVDNRSQSSSLAASSGAPVANRRPANSASTTGHPTEQRHSKILRQAEIFNTLVLNQSRSEPSGPKSTMTLERPKKVTIYGYKVS